MPLNVNVMDQLNKKLYHKISEQEDLKNICRSAMVLVGNDVDYVRNKVHKT